MAIWAQRLPGQVAVDLGGMVLAGGLGGNGGVADTVQPESARAVPQPASAL
jgi:hypothetical protein